jgi:hypothetical protein
VTDRPGKKLLVDTLGLEFGCVSDELDNLRGADPDWWALGKLLAYSIQDRPFIHIDTDVFLWKPLLPDLVDAPVLAQCPEYFHRNADRGIREISDAFTDSSTRLPVEWEWAASREDTFVREENCGIVGGCRHDFLRHYARAAADLVLNPANAVAWQAVQYKSNMALEQFFLSACVDFHRHHPASPFRGVRVDYLFPTWEQAVNPNCATRAGFTHLLGDSKSSAIVAQRLEARVSREDWAFYQRCKTIAQRVA